MAYTFKHGDRPLSGYTIQRGIGRGGFGEVYFAISDGGREVALKYLRDNPDIELRGVSHCMNLKSPHLVTVFDVVKNDEGEYFIIMEHVSGPSLRDLLIAEPNGMGLEKSAFFLREIGRGLAYLHDRGIVHRDLKPANIFYEEGHVKIGDYGLSKFISVSRHSVQTTSVGTVHYMAPEVGSGQYHRGIDIYALGVIVYEMLCGRVPFEGSSMGEILMKHLTEQPEVDNLPEPFAKVIRRALEKDPKDRYQTVHEMLDDVLDVGQVRDSLAGFNPSTITAVPRRHEEDAVSPVPSPNPPRPAMPRQKPVGLDVGQRADLPPKLRRRLQKVSERVEQRMDRLAGRSGRRKRGRAGDLHDSDGRGEFGGGMPEVDLAPVSFGRTFKRTAVSVFLTVFVSIGAGLLVGLNADRAEFGFAAGAMIAAITFGVRLAGRVGRLLEESADPDWVKKLLLLGCAVGPMAAANTPLFAELNDSGIGFFVAMLLLLMTADWSSRLESGAAGELSFGSAFWLAIWGGLLSVMAAGMTNARTPEHFMVAGAAVGGATSLLAQALAWCLRRPAETSERSRGAAGRAGGDAASGLDETVALGDRGAERDEPFVAAVGIAVGGGGGRGEIPFGIPVSPDTPVRAVASNQVPARVRSTFARGFFSVVTFGLLLATWMCIVFAVVSPGRQAYELVVGAVVCGSLMVFFAQKITLYKRIGFWRETVMPFLISVFLAIDGISIAAIATDKAQDGDDFAMAVFGITFSAAMLLVLGIMRFQPRRRPEMRRTRAMDDAPDVPSDSIDPDEVVAGADQTVHYGGARPAGEDVRA